MNYDHTTESADVLLVEDNPGDVRLAQEAFSEEAGAHTLHVVPDGVAALDFCYQRGEYADAPRPDLVLLDLNLPQLDGEDVLTEIRTAPSLCVIPVIILTNSEITEDINNSYKLHANAYLVKPVDPDKYMEAIRAVNQFWLSAAVLPREDT